jgi:hypothetical protein
VTDDDKMDIVCIWLMSIGCLGSMALIVGGALTAHDYIKTGGDANNDGKADMR